MVILPEDNTWRIYYLEGLGFGMTEELAKRYADKKVKERDELGNNDSYK